MYQCHPRILEGKEKAKERLVNRTLEVVDHIRNKTRRNKTKIQYTRESFKMIYNEILYYIINSFAVLGILYYIRKSFNNTREKCRRAVSTTELAPAPGNATTSRPETTTAYALFKYSICPKCHKLEFESIMSYMYVLLSLLLLGHPQGAAAGANPGAGERDDLPPGDHDAVCRDDLPTGDHDGIRPRTCVPDDLPSRHHAGVRERDDLASSDHRGANPSAGERDDLPTGDHDGLLIIKA